MESPRNIPVILDLLAPMARDIMTPGGWNLGESMEEVRGEMCRIKMLRRICKWYCSELQGGDRPTGRYMDRQTDASTDG